MTDEQILEIAYNIEYSCIFDGLNDEIAIKFARAVAAQEREACAKIFDTDEAHKDLWLMGLITYFNCPRVLDWIKKAIRARGE
jgi:hypothetical protein